MPATVTTKEPLPPDIKQDELDALIRLRMKAGAIRCFRQGDELHTEWNVIGEQN